MRVGGEVWEGLEGERLTTFVAAVLLLSRLFVKVVPRIGTVWRRRVHAVALTPMTEKRGSE